MDLSYDKSLDSIPNYIVNTLNYRPPEVFLYQQSYNESVDIWGVGCIFGEMLKGEIPMFEGIKSTDVLNSIFNTLGMPENFDIFIYNAKYTERNELFFDDSMYIEEEFDDNVKVLENNDLLLSMLNLNPLERPNVSKCLDDDYFEELFE